MTDLDELEAIAKAAPQGNWEVHTSNSWRRVMARDKGKEARVIEPTTHPMDKWPDLIFGNGVQAYLEAMQPATILALIAEVRAARAAALEEAAREFDRRAGAWNKPCRGCRENMRLACLLREAARALAKPEGNHAPISGNQKEQY